MLNANQLVGTHDVLFVTLDTLRYDVAQECWQNGATGNLARYLPPTGWEARHSPGNFTYSAHHAFFSGFLPTPSKPGPHPRLFAARFPGSETTMPETCEFDTPDIVSGFAQRDYHTVCIGGVGFFNKQSPLGCVLPGLFDESHWSEALGVTDPHSTENQVRLARQLVVELDPKRHLFLFVNISALHQPNCCYLEGATEDSRESQAAALAYVDRHLTGLFRVMQARCPVVCILCSDHGTAYGEDGFWGHRVSHRVVWTVPYAEFVLSKSA